MTDTVTPNSFDDPIAELNETKDAIRRIIETLDYVHHKLDEAAGIPSRYHDVESQRDMLHCTITHLFTYIEENTKDI